MVYPEVKKSTLNAYYMIVRRIITLFDCPLCKKKSLLAKQFEKHCKAFHNLDYSLCCVWCFGKIKWNKRQKTKNIDHLVKCCRKFKFQHIDSKVSIPKVTFSQNLPNNFKEFNSTKLCEPFDFFGIWKIDDLDPEAYENFKTTPKHKIPVRFRDEDLNSAASYLRIFSENRFDFHHIMIRAATMNNFIRSAKLSKTTFLPFSCWCDGGNIEIDFYRQHRHLIAVSDKGSFSSDLWKKFNLSDRSYVKRNYKCKKQKPIENPMHLMNVIGYLSKRESSCNFTFRNEEEEEKISKGQNHFNILKSLPVDYRIALVLQWDGGILELLDQNYKNLDPAKFIRAPIEFIDRKWQIKIKNIPGINLNVVLPVDKKFRPAKGPTDHYVHLVRGRKFYFEIDHNLEKLNDEAWHRKQLKMGNAFFHVVGEEYWTLSNYQQKYVNDVKPVWDQNDELKRENVQLNTEKVQLEKKIVQLENKIVQLENKIVQLENKIVQLEWSSREEKVQLKTEKVQLERENVQLKTEIVQLKMEKCEERVQLKTENVQLKKDLDEMEKVQLKTENVQLKKENVQLKKNLEGKVQLKTENIQLKKENVQLKKNLEEKEKVQLKTENFQLKKNLEEKNKIIEKLLQKFAPNVTNYNLILYDTLTKPEHE